MSKHLVFIAGSDIDYFYEVEAFLNKGDACKATPMGKKVGGCVLNAASVCSKLGSDVKVLDYLKANDEGTNLLIEALNKNNVDTSNIKYGEDVTNGTCLIMSKGNEKCIYVIDPSRPYFNEDDELKKLLFNASYIYSLMATVNISFKDIELLKEAKKQGAKIIFDAGSQYLDLKEKDILFELADGLFINKTSYSRLCGVCDFNPIEKLLEKGLEFACVTDGDKGVDCYTKEGIIHEDAKKVEVVDSTGAGDSFAGCFLHYLNEGLSIKECLKYALCHGAYACTKLGGMAGAIEEKELLEFIRNNK